MKLSIFTISLTAFGFAAGNPVPLEDSRPTCFTNGTSYTTPKGHVWTVECDRVIKAGGQTASREEAGIDSCVDFCDKHAAHAANYQASNNVCSCYSYESGSRFKPGFMFGLRSGPRGD